MEVFKRILHERGFKATPGRIALLRTLSAARRPLNVDEIKQHLDLNVVTLYRALNDLADQGVLLRGNGEGEAIHFSYPKNHHHHMVCSGCGFKRECVTC